MASKKLTSQDDEFGMFREYWGVLEKYYTPEDTHEYWNGLLDELKELESRHQNAFTRSLILDLLGEIGRRYKNLTGKDI